MAPAVPAGLDRPHFIGIGGAGMSGIAKILAQRGARVAGSDSRESATVLALRALGVTVCVGHAAENLADDATSVVTVELDNHANYASMDEIYASFEAFADRVVPGGTLVVSADHPGARELTARVRDRVKVITYGEAEDADVRVRTVLPRGLTSEV